MNRWRNIWAGCWLALLLAAGGAQAATIVWSDNFDSGAAARWETSGGWSIGSPTVGPPTNSAGQRAFSGADCASTEKYAYNKDGRLVCINYNGASSLQVPAAANYPRLRFWQWYSFANALGYVEVSTNAGSSWIQLSSSYLDVNGGGVWSRPYFDLSGYSGEKILIAFHFTSGGCCGNGLGWFVDDVEVDTGTPELTFPVGFEFDPKVSDWSVDAGTWQIGAPESGPGAAHSGSNCAATVLNGNYLNNEDSRLISPLFFVPSSNSPALRFWHWYSFNNALGYVEINNGSITVSTVTNTIITTNVSGSLNTNIYELFGALNTNYDTPFYWNQTIGGWTNTTRALGSVFDDFDGAYLFEGGIAPLAQIGFQTAFVDYRGTNYPSPLSLNPTNFNVWQGMSWVSATISGDDPVGYFATNFTYSYTTNTTVSSSASQWTQLSGYYEDSASGWNNVSLDLSAYEGQAVIVAFHFISGGTGTDPGWYVDDLSLVTTPQLIVPTNQVVYAGDELMVTNYATNFFLPDASYTYKLLSPPANMSIGATNGVVTWPTTYEQPDSTNSITVMATDNSSPPLTVTNSFVVAVVNVWLPTLPVPTNQTIYGGQTMTVTLQATNELSPGDTYTYALVSPLLTGMDTNDLATDGLLTWATMTTQRIGTYTLAIQATDNAFPNDSATNSFQVILLKPPAPVVMAPSKQTIYAGQTLSVSISATNSVFPNIGYTYAVTNAPAGVAINPLTGALTWTPPLTNKTYTASISVLALDDHTPPLSAKGTFSVTVLPAPAPTLLVPLVVTNYSGRQLAIAISATNPSLPAASYSFSLVSASTNLFITNNSAVSAVLTWTNTGINNGVLTWTNDSVAPRTNIIYVKASDGSSWNSSVTNHFSLVFLPPPRPYLYPLTNDSVFVGQTFDDLLSATNGVLPSATYTLAAASVLTNGTFETNVFTWTNVVAPPGLYPVRVKITDNSVPPILATNIFTVTVLPLPGQLNLGGATLASGEARLFELSLSTPWSNAAWRIEATTNLAGEESLWLPLYTNLTGSSSLIFTDRYTTNFPQRYYRAIYP